MTGYHIELGYCSGASGESDSAANWATLLEVVEKVRHDPERLVKAALAFGAPDTLAGESLEEYARHYATAQDATLEIIPPAAERGGQVMQLASGGGASRILKEHLRRAFCRLVLWEMHRLGIEINLIVA